MFIVSVLQHINYFQTLEIFLITPVLRCDA